MLRQTTLLDKRNHAPVNIKYNILIFNLSNESNQVMVKLVLSYRYVKKLSLVCNVTHGILKTLYTKGKNISLKFIHKKANKYVCLLCIKFKDDF